MIYIDFTSQNIISEGIYAPSEAGKHTVDNRKAELIARANGIEDLKKYFSTSCNDVTSSIIGVQKQWETKFHSQGTEIYSDGTLQVNLTANYNSVFQYSNISKLKTAAGEPIVFTMPQRIPMTALRCGTPTLEISGETSQKLRIQIIPVNSTIQPSAQAKIVKLKFDNQKNALIVENEKDAFLLKEAKISFSVQGNTFLPVAISSSNTTSNL